MFCFTAICSLWAYFWLMLVAVYISPHVVEIWEAWVTFLFFPIMVVIAYCQVRDRSAQMEAQYSLCCVTSTGQRLVDGEMLQEVRKPSRVLVQRQCGEF